jgi:hypothetical protein
LSSSIAKGRNGGRCGALPHRRQIEPHTLPQRMPFSLRSLSYSADSDFRSFRGGTGHGIRQNRPASGGRVAVGKQFADGTLLSNVARVRRGGMLSSFRLHLGCEGEGILASPVQIAWSRRIGGIELQRLRQWKCRHKEARGRAEFAGAHLRPQWCDEDDRSIRPGLDLGRPAPRGVGLPVDHQGTSKRACRGSVAFAHKTLTALAEKGLGGRSSWQQLRAAWLKSAASLLRFSHLVNGETSQECRGLNSMN